MKVLLDENLPHTLRRRLAGHDVYTVRFLGWDSVRNGALLARAAAGGFDAMVTVDEGFAHEHNLATLPLTVIILKARSNAAIDLIPLVPELLSALDNLPPRAIVRIGRARQ